MNDTFYTELEELVNQAFDEVFGRTTKPKKTTMETQTEQVTILPQDLDIPVEFRQVHSYIHSMGEPIGRKQIIENLPDDIVTEETWPTIIKGLKELGLVTQTGAKRGTKYTANLLN